jgi:hypothetical protein
MLRRLKAASKYKKQTPDRSGLLTADKVSGEALVFGGAFCIFGFMKKKAELQQEELLTSWCRGYRTDGNSRFLRFAAE